MSRFSADLWSAFGAELESLTLFSIRIWISAGSLTACQCLIFKAKVYSWICSVRSTALRSSFFICPLSWFLKSHYARFFFSPCTMCKMLLGYYWNHIFGSDFWLFHLMWYLTLLEKRDIWGANAALWSTTAHTSWAMKKSSQKNRLIYNKLKLICEQITSQVGLGDVEKCYIMILTKDDHHDSRKTVNAWQHYRSRWQFCSYQSFRYLDKWTQWHVFS